jgi:hypothetical protein
MKKIFVIGALLGSMCLSAFADTSALAGSISGAASQAGSLSTASQGNAQSITINGVPNPAVTTQQVETSGTSTVKMAPQVYAPPMGVTAPCRVALSAGVSVIGVGVAAGGSVADSPCNLRELSRLYQGIGQTEKAVAVADGALMLECADTAVAAALGDICPAVQQRRPLAKVSTGDVVQKPVVRECRTTLSDTGVKTTVCPY